MLVAIIIFMDLRFPEEIAIFFGTDILQDYEDYYAGMLFFPKKYIYLQQFNIAL